MSRSAYYTCITTVYQLLLYATLIIFLLCYNFLIFSFVIFFFFFFQAEDGIRDLTVTGVQTCALPILLTSTSSRPVCDRTWSTQARTDSSERTSSANSRNCSGVARSGRRAVPYTVNPDRKSTRLNSSHSQISYAVFCLKKKK